MFELIEKLNPTSSLLSKMFTYLVEYFCHSDPNPLSLSSIEKNKKVSYTYMCSYAPYLVQDSKVTTENTQWETKKKKKSLWSTKDQLREWESWKNPLWMPCPFPNSNAQNPHFQTSNLPTFQKARNKCKAHKRLQNISFWVRVFLFVWNFSMWVVKYWKLIILITKYNYN